MTKRTIDAQGKAALFSGQPRHDGPLLVECSGCHASTHVGITKLARLALPFNFTVPFKYHHTWMRCPSCGERRWVRITPFG